MPRKILDITKSSLLWKVFMKCCLVAAEQLVQRATAVANSSSFVITCDWTCADITAVEVWSSFTLTSLMCKTFLEEAVCSMAQANKKFRNDGMAKLIIIEKQICKQGYKWKWTHAMHRIVDKIRKNKQN